MASEAELTLARKKHASALAELGTKAFPNDFRVTEKMFASRKAFVALAADEAACAKLPQEDELTADAQTEWLFGRVVAKRGPFLVIRTSEGDGQALVRKDVLSETEAAALKTVDLADHVAVSGHPIRTKTGAAALSARSYRHVSKAYLPPPGKFHGLTDVEKRYRERYVDLYANPDVTKVFRARGAIVQALRRYLDDRDFLEVETPLLHSVRGGATAKPFNTHHNALDLSLFLRIAPELYLKRLLVGGLDRVYEIGRCFRNEGISTRHNPEFTMLEFYCAYVTFEEVMDMTEEMVRFVDTRVSEKFPALIGERAFDLSAEWAKVPMRTAILASLAEAESPLTEVLTEEILGDDAKLHAAIESVLPKLSKVEQKQLGHADNYGERVFLLYELLAEPLLTKLYRTADGEKSVPVFITEYPFEVSPLARRNDENPGFVDRFELFIDGREICNAFSELNDPDDQAGRFNDQLRTRERGNEEAMDFDADYIRALSHGMPPAGGFGLGVDRLAMLLLGQPSIRDVLLFPLLKPAVDGAGESAE